MLAVHEYEWCRIWCLSFSHNTPSFLPFVYPASLSLSLLKSPPFIYFVGESWLALNDRPTEREGGRRGAALRERKEGDMGLFFARGPPRWE